MLNALTVDVEDYYQVTAFERHVDRRNWSDFPSRVVANTQRLLRLLEQHDAPATFFILGWVAHRFPELVREIHRAGHEIGSHSYWHRLIYTLTPDEFRNDLRLSKSVLEDIIGEPVRAYRAPSFSITRRSLWALDILAEEGFTCDSSIYPIYHDRYGIPNAQRRLHQIETPSGPLWEFPPSVVRLGRMNLPVSGGGYFRLYPLTWTTRSLRRINRRQQPFMFYIHPWEIDPDQPRLQAGSRLSRARHYVNLGRTEHKLSRLLTQFRFSRMADCIQQEAELCVVPATAPFHSATSSALPPR
jgi:polysaccharide deacetylase family protein (PEP-CTERM system associated)